MSPKEKILIVDDDVNICEILTYMLVNNGYDAMSVNSAEEAMALLDIDGDFSLLLLDVMMDGMSGYQMAKKLQEEKNEIPIVFITAKNTENDMLTGFYIGADDYIAKPFSLQEVLARVRAVLRRNYKMKAMGKRQSDTLQVDGLFLDFSLKEVCVDGKKVNLTKTEFEILELLVRQPQHLYSRSEIIAKVWSDTTYITERTVDVHIARLRKKLAQYAHFVSNKSGYGYRFNSLK